jgi:hypothetical protein
MLAAAQLQQIGARRPSTSRRIASWRRGPRRRNPRPANRIPWPKTASGVFWPHHLETRPVSVTQAAGTHQATWVFRYEVAPGCVVAPNSGGGEYAYTKADGTVVLTPFVVNGNDSSNVVNIVLPPDPSGLPPEWVVDPSHQYPNGTRYKNPNGQILDWHPGQPGKPGWAGKDHWHSPDAPNGAKDHLPPGTVQNIAIGAGAGATAGLAWYWYLLLAPAVAP